MMGSAKALSITFSSAVGIKSMILIIEAIEKRSILLDRYMHVSPEATSGIYSRSFFFWLNKLSTQLLCLSLLCPDVVYHLLSKLYKK